MAASPEPTGTERRRRYSRLETNGLVTLTPHKLALLRHVVECKIASLPQLAALADVSRKAARNHLRVLFDAGLVDVVPVPRVALAPPDAPNDARLLYGSAPNIYVPTRDGSALLRTYGVTDVPALARSYGPKNSLFLAHELEVRDVRVWLTSCARMHADHSLATWLDGPDAVVELPSGRRAVQADARFVYQLDAKVLAGFVEVDRGTERGASRWREKLEAYAELFAGDTLRSAIGFRNARVLVVTPDATRRDSLAVLTSELAVEALASRFYLSERRTLEEPAMERACWRVPGRAELVALVPADSDQYRGHVTRGERTR